MKSFFRIEKISKAPSSEIYLPIRRQMGPFPKFVWSSQPAVQEVGRFAEPPGSKITSFRTGLVQPGREEIRLPKFKYCNPQEEAERVRWRFCPLPMDIGMLMGSKQIGKNCIEKVGEFSF